MFPFWQILLTQKNGKVFYFFIIIIFRVFFIKKIVIFLEKKFQNFDITQLGRKKKTW
jgi:hypothetical protein